MLKDLNPALGSSPEGNQGAGQSVCLLCYSMPAACFGNKRIDFFLSPQKNERKSLWIFDQLRNKIKKNVEGSDWICFPSSTNLYWIFEQNWSSSLHDSYSRKWKISQAPAGSETEASFKAVQNSAVWVSLNWFCGFNLHNFHMEPWRGCRIWASLLPHLRAADISRISGDLSAVLKKSFPPEHLDWFLTKHQQNYENQICEN